MVNVETKEKLEDWLNGSQRLWYKAGEINEDHATKSRHEFRRVMCCDPQVPPYVAIKESWEAIKDLNQAKHMSKNDIERYKFGALD